MLSAARGLVLLLSNHCHRHQHPPTSNRLPTADPIRPSFWLVPTAPAYPLFPWPLISRRPPPQALILAVALNSSRNGLVALLIANNFVEIKSTVFKKWDSTRLWALVCAVGRGKGWQPSAEDAGGRMQHSCWGLHWNSSPT